jgi:hypothetical protein
MKKEKKLVRMISWVTPYQKEKVDRAARKLSTKKVRVSQSFVIRNLIGNARI